MPKAVHPIEQFSGLQLQTVDSDCPRRSWSKKQSSEEGKAPSSFQEPAQVRLRIKELHAYHYYIQDDGNNNIFQSSRRA